MILFECPSCGTFYSLTPPIKKFRCKACKKKVDPNPRKMPPVGGASHAHSLRLAKALFYSAGILGAFLLFLSVPTLIAFYPDIPLGLLVLEISAGSLLLLTSSFVYLFFLQLQGLQMLMNLQLQNSSHLSAQVSKLSEFIRKRFFG